MTPLIAELSPREEEVLLLIGDGLGLREIGRMLGISHWTVRNHRNNGRDKLHATSTPHAVAIVVRARATEAVPA